MRFWAPSALAWVFAHPDRSIRQALRWCFWRSGLVWLDEVIDFLFRDRRLRRPVPLTEIRGAPKPAKEYALARTRAAAADSLEGV